MIKIICVGKIKESFYREAVQEYLKRLSKYTRIEIQEVADDGSLEPQTQVHRESECVMKQIQAKDYVILMDIDGRELSSSDFARELDQTFLTNSNITFVIGGSYGLDDTVRSRANARISFSKMTFPHQLFRVIHLEQIYRAYKIINHETYHK